MEKATMKTIVFLSLLVLSILGASAPGWAQTYVSLGALGAFAANSERSLDPGPGTTLTIGHDFSILGIRGTAFYARMESEPGKFFCDYGCGEGFPFFGPAAGYFTSGDENAEYAGGTVDLKIHPLGPTSSVAFSPYFIVGAGGAVLTSSIPDQKNAPGLFANLGLGTSIRLTENLAADIEGLYRPTYFIINNLDEEPFGAQFFTVSGGLRWMF
jgi:hypothetical protein